MKNKILILLSIAALSLNACAKKDVKVAPEVKNDLSNLPTWVLDPNVADGIGGVGIASPSQGGIKFQIPKAEIDAKANIAATIQSEFLELLIVFLRLNLLFFRA